VVGSPARRRRERRARPARLRAPPLRRAKSTRAPSRGSSPVITRERRRMARPAGLEPAAPGLEGPSSERLGGPRGPGTVTPCRSGNPMQVSIFIGSGLGDCRYQSRRRPADRESNSTRTSTSRSTRNKTNHRQRPRPRASGRARRFAQGLTSYYVRHLVFSIVNHVEACQQLRRLGDVAGWSPHSADEVRRGDEGPQSAWSCAGDSTAGACARAGVHGVVETELVQHGGWSRRIRILNFPSLPNRAVLR
jgi:hypothetical protein